MQVKPLEEVAVRLIDPIPPGPPDIFPGFLPSRSQLVITGETNIGKSLLALEICSSLNTNTPLWTHLEPATISKKILYVLGEHDDTVIRKLGQATQLPFGEGIFILGPSQLGSDKTLISRGERNPVAMEKLSKWAEGCGFVVFDPLGAFIAGEGAEQDNNQMRNLLDSMNLVAQSAGASSLVLGHMGKPYVDTMTGEARHRATYATRGASATEDAATNIFYMTRTRRRQTPREIVEAADGEGDEFEGRRPEMFELTCRKFKGEGHPKFRLLRYGSEEGKGLRHELIRNRHYNVEMKRRDTQAAYGRLALEYPDRNKTDLVKMLSTMTGESEATIWRHLQG